MPKYQTRESVARRNQPNHDPRYLPFVRGQIRERIRSIPDCQVAHAEVGTDAGPKQIADLFIGLGRGEFLPYGSYYLTGFLHERPLARLRESLAQLGIERAAGQAEPEDHAAILCEIMAGLASGRFPAPEGAARALFEEHVAPWMERFFLDLEQAEAAAFYRRTGTVGRVLMEIEREAFALPS